MPHAPGFLQDRLQEILGFIQRALERIRADEDAEAELRNLRAYLLDVLDLVERDAGIEAANDDLYASAVALAGADKGTRMLRLTNEAFLRYRDRLGAAQPGRRARDMGLS